MFVYYISKQTNKQTNKQGKEHPLTWLAHRVAIHGEEIWFARASVVDACAVLDGSLAVVVVAAWLKQL